MDVSPETRRIWLELAERLFLDTEFDPAQYQATARLLREAGWTREQAYRTLVELIAPVAGINVGYFLYPVIGEWAGFDPQRLCRLIEQRLARRQQRPAWRFWVADRYFSWVVRRANADRLLALL